jgi:hypothetical protein
VWVTLLPLRCSSWPTLALLAGANVLALFSPSSSRNAPTQHHSLSLSHSSGSAVAPAPRRLGLPELLYLSLTPPCRTLRDTLSPPHP